MANGGVGWRLGLGGLRKGRDMLWDFRYLRGLNGKASLLLGRKKYEVGLGEVEKRMKREKAAKMTSGSDV